MIRKPIDSEFRRKIRERYDQAIAQIDPTIDLAIARTRTNIGRHDDLTTFTDIQKVLETVVAVFTAQCGPLDVSSAALLMLKSIRQTLQQEEEFDRDEPRTCVTPKALL